MATGAAISREVLLEGRAKMASPQAGREAARWRRNVPISPAWRLLIYSPAYKQSEYTRYQVQKAKKNFNLFLAFCTWYLPEGTSHGFLSQQPHARQRSNVENRPLYKNHNPQHNNACVVCVNSE